MLKTAHLCSVENNKSITKTGNKTVKFLVWRIIPKNPRNIPSNVLRLLPSSTAVTNFYVCVLPLSFSASPFLLTYLFCLFWYPVMFVLHPVLEFHVVGNYFPSKFTFFSSRRKSVYIEEQDAELQQNSSHQRTTLIKN